MARSRALQLMPDDAHQELEEAGLIGDYEARPFYQRNDYLAWIRQAKRPETRTKRISRMLKDLEAGGVCMAMDHSASRKE
jgi:uncharacterized protein YdeI (YjbR/CyaY-like superfamily)